MTPTLLQTVFRRVSRLAADPISGPTAADGSDADLLRKFAESQDESAFLALLDRHGPLAWAVCRQMLPDPADAEDAFQATFLALVQSAKKLGRVKSVGGWLHGVAVRVCLKVRRSAVRRKQREERAAKPEGVAFGEPEWDTLHAAVHEEIHRLPAVLRAVFVLCELEGVRQPDAATRLGCKLGTVSGRLARARQALLKALTARGLAPVVAVGTIAVGGAATALSPLLIEKALAAARSGQDIGLAVPSGVIQLAQSVSEGAFMKTKLMVAATLVAAGLMVAVGGVSTADAQAQPPAAEQPARTPQPRPRPAPVDPQDLPPARAADPAQPPRQPEPPRPPRNIDPDDPRPPRPADPARPGRPADPRDPPEGRSGPADRPPVARGPQQRMEHELFDVPTSKDELSKLIKKQESTGWEFAGQVDMGKGAQLVFKRPKGNPPGMGWGVPAPQPPRGEPLPRRGEPGDAPLPPRGVPQPPRGEPRDPVAPRGEPLPRRGGADLPPPVPQPQPRRGGADSLPPADEFVPSDLAPIPSPTPITTPAPTPSPLRADSFLPAALPSEGVPFATVPAIPPARIEDGEIHVIELKHASPTSISNHVKTFFEVQVNVDEDTGSLVVRCNKKTLAEIEKLVEKLDKPSKRIGA